MSIDFQISPGSASRPAAPVTQAALARASRAETVDRPETAGKTIAAPQELASNAEASSVDRVAQAAATALFEPRQVAVEGRFDEGSGRFVYQISDKSSGEVLAQSPPDALLRFYASFREATTPLIDVGA